MNEERDLDGVTFGQRIMFPINAGLRGFLKTPEFFTNN